MLDVYVDGDACPVKTEVFRVALRHGLKVFVVSHGPLHVRSKGDIEVVRVKRGFGAADDWIAEHAAEDDIVVTTDVPLADRCLKKGARVLAPNGKVFTEASIGDAVANRDLMQHLREMGAVTGGPPPFAPADRSRFLSGLHDMIERIRRGGPARH